MSAVISIFGDVDPNEVPLYTVHQAAAYLQVPHSTLRAWTVGQDYPRARGRTGRFQPLIQPPAGKPVRMTFNNLIEAFVLMAMTREPNEDGNTVDLGTVRRAIENMRSQFGVQRPLLDERVATDGVGIYLNEIDSLLDIGHGRGRQYAMKKLIDGSLRRISRDARGIAARLYPFRSSVDEPCSVAIDPRLSFGRPTVDGSGVAVAIVANLVDVAKEKPERVAKEFGLSKAQVMDAVEWHRHAAA